MSSLHASSEPGSASRTALPFLAYSSFLCAMRLLYVLSSSIHQSVSSFVSAVLRRPSVYLPDNSGEYIHMVW